MQTNNQQYADSNINLGSNGVLIDEVATTKLNAKLAGMLTSANMDAEQKSHREQPDKTIQNIRCDQKMHTEKPDQKMYTEQPDRKTHKEQPNQKMHTEQPDRN